MESLKCILVDDDPLARKVLEQLCIQTDLLKIVSTFSSSTEAYKYLSRNKVDLLFLDIEMPGMSGLDLLRSLTERPKVILTTGKKEFAVDAFDLDVADYLVKPIEYPRFLKALSKIRESETRSSEAVERHIFIKSQGVFQKISYDDITHLEAQGDYISIYTGKSRITIYDTLKNFESKLNRDFIRVHRSFIINKKHILSIEDNCISLAGSLIPIGVSYRTEVMRSLNLG